MCKRTPTMILLIFYLVSGLSFASLLPIHYTITRRGGSFPAPDTANLTYLLEQLQIVESRFHETTRSLQGNKVVRKPKRVHGTQGSTVLLGEVGREGNWFADLRIGQPVQQVDMDLDMLTADWYILSTSSRIGSFYLDFNSKTYVDSERPLSFPTCREPTDVLHLPTTEQSITISFAHCRPAKQWTRALLPSGAYLGLAPSQSLSQTKSPSLMPQLLDKGEINATVWSLLLINGQNGILTIGGTSITSIGQAKKETDDVLAQLTKHEELKRSEEVHMSTLTPGGVAAENALEEWKWSKVHGAEGWWQILMRGIWVDNNKILDSQPIIVDVNTPFIVAPPLAARVFYSSIFGSRQLQVPHDQFYAYPCFNTPKIHFEFAGWTVEVLKGNKDKGTFSPGGRFSLGRKSVGSGYCIGIVVESRMGSELGLVDGAGNEGPGYQTERGNGLDDVWILGEPFFRDVQVAFDWKEKKVGMQKI